MDKAKTRWEKFAETKNIRKNRRNPHLNKKLEWDENSQEWKKKWGFKKANNEFENVIFEHNENDISKDDPWTRMKNEKKKRMAINEENRMTNLQAAFGNRLNGTVDLQSAIKHSKMKRKGKLNNNNNNNNVNKKYVCFVFFSCFWFSIVYVYCI